MDLETYIFKVQHKEHLHLKKPLLIQLQQFLERH